MRSSIAQQTPRFGENEKYKIRGYDKPESIIPQNQVPNNFLRPHRNIHRKQGELTIGRDYFGDF